MDDKETVAMDHQTKSSPEMVPTTEVSGIDLAACTREKNNKENPKPGTSAGEMQRKASEESALSFGTTAASNAGKITKKEKDRAATKSSKKIGTPQISRRRKASWYHDVAASNRVGSIQETFKEEVEEDIKVEDTQESLEQAKPTQKKKRQHNVRKSATVRKARQELLDELNRNKGDPNTSAFQVALQNLLKNYNSSTFDPRAQQKGFGRKGLNLEGTGISAGKPSFPGFVGRNDQGDSMYKLGTMSFDMFCPTQLIVSVQGTFVLIDTVDGKNDDDVKNVPTVLLADVREGTSPLRSYDIVTPFTIEPWRPEFGDDSPNKEVDQPIRGVMTTNGFMLPYDSGNRFSVWFTGGCLEVDGHKNDKWFKIFDREKGPKRTLFESGKVLAAKLLVGASTNDELDEQGRLSYTLTRPMAGHIDLIYLDKSLQIMRASSGTVYVHVRLARGGAGRDSCVTALLDPFVDERESESYGDVGINKSRAVAHFDTVSEAAIGISASIVHRSPAATSGSSFSSCRSNAADEPACEVVYNGNDDLSLGTLESPSSTAPGFLSKSVSL